MQSRGQGMEGVRARGQGGGVRSRGHLGWGGQARGREEARAG